MDDRPAELGDEAEGEVSFTPRELALIAEAREAAAAEGTIPWHTARAWALSLGTANEDPMPEPRKRD